MHSLNTVHRAIIAEPCYNPCAMIAQALYLSAGGVANANAVTTSLRALDGRELVVRKGRGRVWDVAEPFLRAWLVRS